MKKPDLCLVTWTDDNKKIVSQIVCTLHELEEVLNSQFPENATAREPVCKYTGIPSEVKYWKDCWWVMPVGSSVSLFINQGWRDATILAEIGIERLVEYEMSNGTTSLRVMNIYTDDYKNASYKTISKKWLNAMKENDAEWICNPQ